MSVFHFKNETFWPKNYLKRGKKLLKMFQNIKKNNLKLDPIGANGLEKTLTIGVFS